MSDKEIPDSNLLPSNGNLPGLDGIDLCVLLEVSFVGISGSCSSGRFLFASSTVQRITGVDPADMVGKSTTELLVEGTIPYITVLFEGETGVGTDILARFLHDKSASKKDPSSKRTAALCPSTF